MRQDEKKHLLLLMLYSALVVVLFRIELDPIGWKVYNMYNWDCAIAAFSGIFISIGKEVIWDKLLGKGTPQFYDAVFGSIGSIVGPGIVLLIEGIAIMFV